MIQERHPEVANMVVTLLENRPSNTQSYGSAARLRNADRGTWF